MLCWFPYACTSIAEVAGYRADTELSYYVLAIPVIIENITSYLFYFAQMALTKTSVCTDPIIYFWLNPQVLSYVKLSNSKNEYPPETNGNKTE